MSLCISVHSRQWRIHRRSACALDRRHLTLSLACARQCLIPLLWYAGRLMDGFLCIISLALFYIVCYREKGFLNFTFCQQHAHSASMRTPIRSLIIHRCGDIVSVILLWLMSFVQCFTSTFRFVILQVGASDELAPPSSKRKFIIFAIGVVATPIIHVSRNE